MNTYKPYVPQYKEMEIEPLKYPVSRVAPAPQPQRTPFLAPREEPAQRMPFIGAFQSKKREAQSAIPAHQVSVPYAEQGVSISRTTPMPNVGNNIETTWTSTDFSLVDNPPTSIDPNHPMIDNNEFVSDNVFGYSPPQPTVQEPVNPFRSPIKVDNTPATPTESSDYYLFVKGQMISNGTKTTIQGEVEALMYEAHPLSKDYVITPDDIMVLKKVAVNVGVFLGE